MKALGRACSSDGPQAPSDLDTTSEWPIYVYHFCFCAVAAGNILFSHDVLLYSFALLIRMIINTNVAPNGNTGTNIYQGSGSYELNNS